MKTPLSNRLFLLLIIPVLLIIGCINPPDQITDSGKLSISISEQVSKTILPSISMEPAAYLVEGAGPEGATFSETVTGEAITVENLTPGDWTVSVTAYNSSDTAIGEGSGAATVNSNTTSSLSVTVNAYDGFGTLDLTLNWNEEDIDTPQVQSTLLPVSGSERNLTFTVNAASASFSASDVSSGYHTLSVRLLDGGEPVKGAVDVVRIAADQTTIGQITFDNINKPDGIIEVNIIADMGDPLTVSIAGAESFKLVDESMNLSASIDESEVNAVYVWYVNGVSVETGENYIFDNSWEAGYYRIDVTAYSADGSRAGSATANVEVTEAGRFLTQPFLQSPTEDSVRVVWFTEYEGDSHWVEYGETSPMTAFAVTNELSRMREDDQSWVGEGMSQGEIYTEVTDRTIFRHEAVVTGLENDERVPYFINSEMEDGRITRSKTYSLRAKPAAGTDLKILLTSDHQSKSMTPANLQKVTEEIGMVDAVFFAGDLVNVPDAASQWFDDNRGTALFPGLQGLANKELSGETYQGGEIIQNAPLYSCVGNHEVMGVYSETERLLDQFNNPRPAEWNTISYEEILSMPESATGGELYYAETIGSIRLISLFVTRIWRTSSLGDTARGKYREAAADFDNPEEWGYGSFIFKPINTGSEQYEWLEDELASAEFAGAEYKVVMFHHQFHSLGGNVVPAFVDPVQIIEESEPGVISAIRYEYPLDEDYMSEDLEPLFESAGVDLVLNGHSHLWNRFVSTSGINYLETSNVGNTYGAYWGGIERGGIPSGYDETYVASGDPYGLEPVVPNISPIGGNPYISSNNITVFSILDTAIGTVSSYYYNTSDPGSSVVKFDEFSL